MRSHGTLCCGARLLRRCAHRQKQSVRDGADYRTLPRRKPGSIFRQHELRIGGSRPAPGQPFHPGRVGRAGPCATCEDDSVIASPRVRALRGPRTCVDGPRLARIFRVSASNVACGLVSGLNSAALAAGPDGIRGSRSDQAPGVAMPHVLGEVSLDPSVDRRCHHASSPSQVLCVSQVLFLGSIRGPFLRPDRVCRWRRAQPRSRLAEGHRRRRARSGLDGGEHGARLARGRARLIVLPTAEVLLAHHHRPADARHLIGERAGSDLARLALQQLGQPGIPPWRACCTRPPSHR